MPRTRDDLRFDRRLARRPGWTSQKEWNAHLEQLPDIAHKGVTEAPGDGAEAAAPDAPEAEGA